MAVIVSGDLQGASGKIGNKVYYQSNGKTVVRSISASNYNSKTVQQLLQRVIIKTVASNYAAMKDIVNHSFQGVKKGADSMAKFSSLNAQYLRDRAAEIVDSGNSLDSFIQFSKLGSKKFIPGALYLSEGTLTQLHPGITAFTVQGSAVATLDLPANTYQSLADRYNLRRGDQLTFVTVEKDAYGEYLFKYSRVILDPRTNDGDAAPMSSALVSDSNAINLPSRRNEGSYYYLGYADGALKFKHINGDVAAVAIIASRKSGSDWFRSTSQFVLSEGVIGSDAVSLLGAIIAAQSTSSSEIYIGGDDLYLNNAGTGGSQGTVEESQSDTPQDTTPYITNTVSLNGASQNVSGGSVTITQAEDSVSNGVSVVINGGNLTSEDADKITIQSSIEGVAIQNKAVNDAGTQISFRVTGYSTLPASFTVKNDGTTWFTVTVNESDDVNAGFDMG